MDGGPGRIRTALTKKPQFLPISTPPRHPDCTTELYYIPSLLPRVSPGGERSERPIGHGTLMPLHGERADVRRDGVAAGRDARDIGSAVDLAMRAPIRGMARWSRETVASL